MKYTFSTILLLIISSCEPTDNGAKENFNNLNVSVYSESYPPQAYLQNPDSTPKKFLSQGSILGEERLQVKWEVIDMDEVEHQLKIGGKVITMDADEICSGADIFSGSILETYDGEIVVEILNRTSSDNDGNFELTCKLDTSNRLYVSYVGYSTNEYRLRDIFEILQNK